MGPTEREQFLTEMDNHLQSERDSLQEQIDSMKRTKFGAVMVSENDEKCKFYTGLSWCSVHADFYIIDTISTQTRNVELEGSVFCDTNFVAGLQ